MSEREQALNALKQAERAARLGDLAEAERWSKTADRMAAAAEKLAALPKALTSQQEQEEEDALRAELLGRIERLVDASSELTFWEGEREIHERICAFARERGVALPPPLPPAPYTESDLDRIASGEGRSLAASLATCRRPRFARPE